MCRFCAEIGLFCDLEHVLAENPIKNMRLKAMDFLARREYSHKELKQKLFERFPDSTEIEQVLDGLIKDGLQSDARFADSFFRLRVNAGYGPNYIRAELRQRGIDEALVAEVFSEQGVDWGEAARQVFDKKFSGVDLSDQKARAKCMRFMQYKGFTFDQIKDLL
jgi:regulatory protein